MLTPAELKQIKEYLMMYGKKDSQFRVLSELSDNDLIAFVRSHENFATHLTDIKDFIATAIADEGVHDSEGNPLVMSEENFTTLLKDKLGDIEADAQVNVIEKIKVDDDPDNPTLLPIDTINKSVTIPINDRIKSYIMNPGQIDSNNKLTDKNYVAEQINAMDAVFLGSVGDYIVDTDPEDTQAATSWVSFCVYLQDLIDGTNVSGKNPSPSKRGDKNDYIFCLEQYTDDRLSDSDVRYIYYRWKYTNPEDHSTNSQWSEYKGWKYEYQLIPYYLNTDKYPTADSKNAVESNGILAVTGNVPYTESEGVRTYIDIQSQLDTLKSYHYTPSFTLDYSYIFPNTATAFTATAKLSLNGVAQTNFTVSTPTEPTNWVVGTTTGTTRTFTNTITVASVGSTVTISTTISQGTYSSIKSATITSVYPIYYYCKQTADTEVPSNKNTATPRGNATGAYSVSFAENDYFIISVPASMNQPSQLSLYSDYSYAANLISIGTANIEGVSYQFWRSEPQHATAQPINVYIR